MINIVVSSDSRYDINKRSVEDAVATVLKAHKVSGRVEVEIIVVGDRKMHELNRKYRGIDSTTDVLSFAFEDPHPQNLQMISRVGFLAAADKILRLGSIVISYPQALEDASLDGVSVDEEINYLVEHGTLHLLGLHHD